MNAVDRLVADAIGDPDNADPRYVELLTAWHQYQHAYQGAQRTRPGGYIVGVIPGQCRAALDAMADILAQAHVCPAHPWPWAAVRLDGSCCGTQRHG